MEMAFSYGKGCSLPSQGIWRPKVRINDRQQNDTMSKEGFVEKEFTKKGMNTSYANSLTKNLNGKGNQLFSIPTGVNCKGEEVVLFDEEFVKEGSEKWNLTVCGYFVGCRMSVNELKYHTRRMWGRYGLKDIAVDTDDMCFFKFKNEDDMQYIIEQSPWIVNGKPLIVQKWDPEVIIKKESPSLIPVWVRLFNVPLEAWSIKGISAISSRLGKPVMMDQMTSDMCKGGTGRLGYARVLVEIDAGKNYVDKVEINYVDDKKNVKMSKWVKVEYSWKPDKCSHCKVFGHGNNYCKEKPAVSKENEKRNVKEVNTGGGINDEFMEVRNRKNRSWNNGGAYVQYGVKQMPYRNNVTQSKYVVKPKVPNPTEVSTSKINNSDPKSNGSKNPRKSWKISKENVEELKRSANKFSVLTEEDRHDEEVDIIIDKRLIVDEFIKKKLQPSVNETKDWDYDMINYFKYSWEAMEKNENELSDDEDVNDSMNQAVNHIIADEVLGNVEGEFHK
ncbi:RNA-directed DNA polymerase, eukaryota, reverse transcriptase zinc-binding domain protein [Tanacetum coccineum]